MAVFFGTFENKVDRKGRVSVPAPFRQALAGSAFQGIIARASHRTDAIEAFDLEFMAKLNTSVSTNPLFSETHDDLSMTIFGESFQLGFDGEGRIVLPPDLVEQYPQATKRGEALYYANVTNMDRAVGRLMAALDEFKLADNTFVFFTSDNGPETLDRYRGAWRSHGSPGPLRGMKLHLYEAGMRVPGIIRFPGHTKAGQILSEPVCSLDILPTFCELAGVEPPADRALDGANFLPIFSGKPIERQVPLYWHYFRSIGEPKAAMRVGDWMILGHWDGPLLGPGGSLHPGDMELIKSSQLVDFELYNLRDDLAEKNDLAAKEPERLKQLSALLVEKYKQVQTEGRNWELPSQNGK